MVDIARVDPHVRAACDTDRVFPVMVDANQCNTGWSALILAQRGKVDPESFEFSPRLLAERIVPDPPGQRRTKVESASQTPARSGLIAALPAKPDGVTIRHDGFAGPGEARHFRRDVDIDASEGEDEGPGGCHGGRDPDCGLPEREAASSVAQSTTSFKIDVWV
ncbi:hypothetical protein AA23498_2380 [Acetobacter nitrogenifigens DSM 23921 = NBRC 105050]|uniref:Uncharacterized protein n=1 Tax=Acetobacter nitrogenifigens DSM 23921 = NBRC 105050 TaxID=1120919 RepID=A0A511X7F7_9PROT|nr:hypothetical protein AA23498_2380 [Acetobacter nitrogenifigens DSM 23921 = NBRC 105050]GEN58884.1 hypothetical protein ANI02nite_07680 [Acetobacter nitrogenifigens DSM 23921 = NBRC 105050]